MTAILDLKGRAGSVLPFREIWVIDFEFRADPGERPDPVCLVAREIRSGHVVRLWANELRVQTSPFGIGSDILFVAYFASAEIGCFLALGWEIPARIIDLFVEHRVETNGVSLPCGNGLLGALIARGLPSMAADDKEVMRRHVLDQTSWTGPERVQILDYCEHDVHATAQLLDVMAPTIDLPRALLRGRYMAALARMEWVGIPVDTNILSNLNADWEAITTDLIAAVDRDYGIYEEGHFRQARFGIWLDAHGMPWPRLPSGGLDLSRDTFRQQANAHAIVQPLYELRTTLAELRLNRISVGADGRNRALLSPFSSTTGRNQPSNARFLFGPARWIRGLIRPPPGYGLAYVDWSAQEIAIAAALSGDEGMINGYLSGDPYLAFAKAAALVPPEATKLSHKGERDRCKAVVLGVNYGMGERSLASSIGVTELEARELLRLHKRTYPRFWRWSDEYVATAMFAKEMTTCFGWRRQVGPDDNPRSLMNWPMQAHGAEMMRIAAIGATEAGIEVCAPIHDAFLICAPLEQLESHTSHMREIMEEAAKAVTGLAVRADATFVRHPERYMDERGAVILLPCR